MKINFRVKDKRAKTSYIFVDVLIAGIRVKHSTGIEIIPNEFNPEKQRLKSDDEPSHLKNQKLAEHESAIRDELSKLELTSRISREKVKQTVKAALGIQNNHSYANLLDYVHHHIKRIKGTLKQRTLLHYGTSLAKFEAYEKAKRVQLQFDDIDYEFYLSFVEFCKSKLKLTPNTIGGHIKNLKTWLDVAYEEGVNRNLAFKSRGFKTMSEEMETIYLIVDELNQIKGTELPYKLEKVRDLFLGICSF